MNRIRIIFEIIKILSGTIHYMKSSVIKTRLFESLEIDIKDRTVKKYLDDIQKQFEYPLESKTGVDGGYRLLPHTRKAIALLAQLRLNDEEKNALNDAFEIASKNLTYYYNKDLQSAIDSLYLKINLKDQDYEYYTGKANYNDETTNIIKQVKYAMMAKLYIHMESKYEYFNIPKEKGLYIPLYIIHDLDESFVVLKTIDNKYLYQNILNIKSWVLTDKVFDAPHEDIEYHKNDHTISIKPQHNLQFTIVTERGHSIFDLWNYDFENNSPESKNKKNIVFYEEYKVYEFLLRIQVHIKDLKVSEKIKDGWNKRLKNLKKI